MAEPDLITRLAREADLEFSATVGLDGQPNDVPTTVATLDDMRRFAALVAAECAKVAEMHVWFEADENIGDYDLHGPENQHKLIALAIRAKFKEPT